MRQGLVGGRVLVTGAGGGIGSAVARAFARHGAELLLSGRRAAQLAPLAAELHAATLEAELSIPAEVEALAAAAGEVDILIANAALPASGQLTEFTQSQIAAIVGVNLGSQIALARALLPGMLARGRGHLVFISSLSGKAPSPSASLYNATKFGVRGFALGLREDLRGSGVGASVVLPGFIREAGMFARSGASLPPGVGTRTPDHVADAVLRAVVHNHAEVHVAPLHLRVGADIASVAPELAGRAQRLLGGRQTAERVAAGQRDRRPPP